MAKILIIEDIPANRLLVTKLLRYAGHAIVEAEDGASGVAAAAQELPDLIIMDISLPQMDGYEALRRIRSLPDLQHIPIIALTAHAMVGDEQRAQAAGFTSYITKPIEVSQFVSQINQILDSK